MEQELSGGGVNRVVRVGDTVRRPPQPWGARTVQLLEHVAARGFAAAPRPVGPDTFTYLHGEVGHYPWTAAMASDAALVGAARLLRGYHDATADVAQAWLEGWQWPAREPVEVVCHNDFAPYNCVYDGDRVVGVIDFDTAAPGPRSWDLAYAVYRFVPLGSAADVRAVERLGLFFDGYGAGADLRASALADVVPRLRAMVGHMRTEAAAGNAAFAEHIARGDLDLYLRDIELIERSDFPPK